MPGDSLRLLIADDHPLFRKGMRTLLGAAPDFALVGEAETGMEAVARSLALLPDVVLMDLQMPGGSGIEATREIVAASPTTRVLVVTLFEDDGIGIVPGHPAGVGLLSMRERAEELGGRFNIGPRADGTGTRLEVRLPLPIPAGG
jgi:CheY-like chemotaxis protein